MQNRIQILNTTIDKLDLQQTIQKVNEYILNKKPLHLMGVNADKINMLNQNPRLKEIVNSCEIINADGASVILASKFLGTPLPERVAGIDLMSELTQISALNGYKIFLLGATQEIVEKTAVSLSSKYPNLKIVGIHNGYFSRDQWTEIAQKIKESEAQIVFVGITSPLKEYLVDFFLNDAQINCVFMGVGGSFDVLSGSVPRAPVWMQKHNLEWFFRFCQEPRRLFKRYFIGNWKFIYAIWQEKRSRYRT